MFLWQPLADCPCQYLGISILTSSNSNHSLVFLSLAPGSGSCDKGLGKDWKLGS